MGHILPFTKDPHRETRDLMPWLITGRLGPEERARIETHLAACADCSRELAAERALASDIAELPIATGIGWAAMRDRLDSAAQQASYVPAPQPFHRRFTLRQIGTVLAAQAALLAAAVTVTLRVEAPMAPYHALSSAPVTAAGNAIVGLALSFPTNGAVIGARGGAALTLVDTTTAVQFEQSLYTMRESRLSAIRVVRSGVLATTAKVGVTVSGISAGIDFEPVSQMLTFAPGVTTRIRLVSVPNR